MRLKLGFSERIGFFWGVFSYICGMNDTTDDGYYSQGKQDAWEFPQELFYQHMTSSSRLHFTR
jgi:hypothetical protein